MNGIFYGNINKKICTYGKTPLNSHYPKINGIQCNYFNSIQWETLPRDGSVQYDSLQILTSFKPHLYYFKT